jgi:hypothetical protein
MQVLCIAGSKDGWMALNGSILAEKVWRAGLAGAGLAATVSERFPSSV